MVRARRGERWLVATTEYAGLTAYTGGIGRHYASLLPGLVRQGVDVDLAVFSDGPFMAARDLRGVRVVAADRMDGMPRPRALAKGAWSVRRLFATSRYDRVFVPEWSGLGAALPRSAPLLTNLATGMRLANEVSRLGLGDFPPGRRPDILAQSALESRQIRRSAGLIAISTAMLHWTTAAYPRLPPAVVVRNCIDVDAVRHAGRTGDPPEQWPAGDDPVVLFLGRAERRKGIIEAFDAFGRLHARLPAARLVVAGAGGDPRFEPTRAELMAMLPSSARPLVVWLGHVAGDELYGAVRAASVVVCPSRWEGFGNVALEARAVGAPLVVTSGSGFDDFCEDGVDCIAVRAGDATDLADGMLEVLRHPGPAAERARRGSSGVDRFAPDPVARDLLAAADGILGRPSTRS